MEQVTAPEVEQQEKETARLIPEERLEEILNILLPYGYSYYNGRYTGVSPYIGDSTNIITVIANDPGGWGVFSICMEHFSEDDEADENDSLGFYKGIMKVIAPELHSGDKKFKGLINVLDFYWAPDKVKDNRFPVKVEYRDELL
ncbi:MAG: hypothetical protein IKA00_06490 [Prevotella sp.]|nr:hypothetical protein [Prevotella sp.]